MVIWGLKDEAECLLTGMGRDKILQNSNKASQRARVDLDRGSMFRRKSRLYTYAIPIYASKA